MTKADWIRNMTNDELAQFIRLIAISECVPCSYANICCKDDVEEDFCVLGVEQWLKQEHKERGKNDG